MVEKKNSCYRYSRKAFKQWFDNKEEKYEGWIIESLDKSIIGCLFLCYNNHRTPISRTHREIPYFKCDENYLRKGIATKLYDAMLEQCKEDCVEEIIAGCYDDNIPAKRFFEQNGYSVRQIRGKPEVVYTLLLTPGSPPILLN